MTFEPTGENWIGGRWIAGNGDAGRRCDPFRGDEAWRGCFIDSSQADLAMEHANAAFVTWSQTSIHDRISLLKQFSDIVSRKRSDWNLCITRETGKPLWESDTETSAVIGKVQNSIDAIHQRRWVVVDSSGDPASVIRYRPIGVMVVLGPFNLPAHLPGAHIVPALLAGNTVVFKPSEQTPGVGEFLVRCWQEAGCPPGVLQMVQGGGEVAQWLVQDRRCNGVLFTGSYRVGRLLHQILGGRPDVMLALELGGNNPLVVDRTQSIDSAVYQIILSAFITSGQRCTCARRLILTDEGNGRMVLQRLIEVMPSILVGDPYPSTQPFMGTLISPSAANHIMMVRDALVSAGGKEIVPLQQSIEHPAMVTPGLVEVDAKFRGDEEWFGPLLTVQHVRDLDEAIEAANATRFGLSAGLIADDIDSYHHFVHRVRAGIVNWNRQTTGASGKLPFGGVGDSGNHRPSGFFASDYCSYPIASLESQNLPMPTKANPGLERVIEHFQSSGEAGRGDR